MVGDDQAGRAVSFVVALPLEVVVTVSFSFSGAGSFLNFILACLMLGLAMEGGS